jgi:hypothetical protein
VELVAEFVNLKLDNVQSSRKSCVTVDVLVNNVSEIISAFDGPVPPSSLNCVLPLTVVSINGSWWF